MVTKVWADKDGSEFRCCLNTDNLCLIEINSEPMSSQCSMSISLDLEDIEHLIKELRLIKSVMKIYQNEQK